MTEGEPRGVPRHLLMEPDHVQVRMAMVDALDGDFPAAILFQRIEWRCRMRGYWRATYQDLIDETRLGEYRVKRALKLLRERGWLTAERASSWDAGMVYRAVYQEGEPAESTGGTPPDRAGGFHRVEPEVSTRSDREVSTRSSSKTGKNRGDERQDTSPAADAAGALIPLPASTSRTPTTSTLDAEFTAWWSVYPRREGKADALRAFGKARKGGTSLDTLLEGARRLAESGRDPQFIPHAATWLNGRRWEDEPPPPPPPPTDRQALILREEFRRAQEADARHGRTPS